RPSGVDQSFSGPDGGLHRLSWQLLPQHHYLQLLCHTNTHCDTYTHTCTHSYTHSHTHTHTLWSMGFLMLVLVYSSVGWQCEQSCPVIHSSQGSFIRVPVRI